MTEMHKYRPWLLIAALVLPLAALGYSWFSTDRAAANGVEWDVSIQGYDPRDLLQGHYLQYEYMWKIVRKTNQENYYPSFPLCIKGTAPVISSVTEMNFDSREDDMNCISVIRPDSNKGNIKTGRYYIPQEQAAALEGKLRDPKLRATMRVRINPQGVIRPIALRFSPA